jgi:predicted RNA binding protein YcfA (HicA-like mRNA interferase family)
MPKPISRRELIRRLRNLGWVGPYPRGKHMGMQHPDGRRVLIPNPHGGDIDWSLTKRLLDQAGITPEEFDAAK